MIMVKFNGSTLICKKYFERKELLGFKLEVIDPDLANIVRNLDDDKDNVGALKDKYFQIVYHNDIGMPYKMI